MAERLEKALSGAVNKVLARLQNDDTSDEEDIVPMRKPRKPKTRRENEPGPSNSKRRYICCLVRS